MIKRIRRDGFFSLRPHGAGIVSLLCTAVFFVLYLAVFRLGYLVNDDITMISLVSGYLGGTPVPFMNYSNVIWGFLLIPLYATHSNLNWEIWLFILINFLSVWALVFIALSRPVHILYKLAGVLAVLACDGFFLIDITYTEIAVFAVLAGACLILMTACSQAPLNRSLWVGGAFLILIGSLIRIEAILLVLFPVLLSVLMIYPVFNKKRLVLMFAATILGVIGCSAFDGFYVGIRYPAWYAYYRYDDARSLVFDTPRAHIENIGDVLPDVGWTRNDYTLFINWYFPDREVSSLSKLRYLVDHVSDSEHSLNNAIQAYFRYHHIFNARDAYPYFLVMAATWALALLHPPLRRSIPALTVLLAGSLVLILYLVWKKNVPLHVWYSVLATIGIFGLCILAWNANTTGPGTLTGRKVSSGVFPWLFLVMTSVAFILALSWTSATSKENVAKQSAYQQMLSDLDSLQAEGRIAPNALIVSPAAGIPIEWSDPLFLSWPHIQYFQMEWLTFSPAYEDVLRQHGARSLPAGFYEEDDIYLMTRTTLIPNVVQSIKEHEGIVVKVLPIYSNNDNAVTLYRLVRQN